MKTLVTGGSGFLGQHLLPLLEADQVWAPSSGELNLADPLAVAQAVAEFKPERVFHLGALTSPRAASMDPERAVLINVGGTRSVCQAMLAHTPSARLVHVSTCHVYGRPLRNPVTEAHPLNAEGAYAQSKAAAEAEVQAVVSEGFDAVIVRPFNLFGPGQSTDYALADWCAQSVSGRHHILCGDLDIERDYLDVRDAAQGLVLIANRGLKGGAYNLCRGHAEPLRYLMALVAPGCEPHVEPGRLRADPVAKLQGSRRKAGALGWGPAFSLEQTAVDLRLYLSSRTSI